MKAACRQAGQQEQQEEGREKANSPLDSGLRSPVPRDRAGWASSTLAQQELGCGACNPGGFETAKLLASGRQVALHCVPAAKAFLTGELTQQGRAGQGVHSHGHKDLKEETVAQQVGGSSCQDDSNKKKAARLKHKDSGIKSLPEGTRGTPGETEL